MANDYSNYNSDNGYAGFNYGTESEAIKRKRMAAQQLAQLALQQDKGQIIQNNMGTFYAGASPLTGLAKVAAAYLSTKANDNLDQSQRGLDQTSANALAYQLSPPTQGAAAQVAPPTPAADNNNLAPIDTSSDAQSSPTPGGSATLMPLQDAPPTPTQSISPEVKALIAKNLSNAGGGRGGQGGPTADQLASIPATTAQLQAAGQRRGSSGSLRRMAYVAGSDLPVPVDQPDQQVIGGPTYQDPASTSAPVQAPQPTGFTPPPAQPMALPPQMPAPQQPAPQMPAPQDAPPMAAPPQAAPPAAAPQAMPPQQPAQSMGDHIKQLTAIANTGPLGMQIATSQLNQMFASKNGRYTTTVHADPVNGGFVQVTTDTQTGASHVEPIVAGSGKIPIGETTDASGTRYNRFKDGSTAVMRDPQGNPMKDPGVIRTNEDQQVKLGAAVTANQSARSSIDSSLARLDRIEQLYHDTYAGPLGGNLPNWNSKRQELHSLLAQDIFAETRDAVAGAADAGGAPRMAQSEFKYMSNNGGLSQTTTPEAATNLIAQQKMRLLAMKQSLSDYGKTINSIAPPAQQTPVALPPRGMTFTGPNAAAASRLGLGGQ